jgi:monoamine oxidase
VERIACDVGIIGGGVAGLAAAATLTRAGSRVCCLEACDRVGGRILTVRDPLTGLPVELGAEFVHGRPAEILDLLPECPSLLCEHTSTALHLQKGRIVHKADVGELADQVLTALAKSKRRKDETFEQYLKRSRHAKDLKDWARLHVEGFNAAHSDRISVGSLLRETAAADEIEGDRTHRILNGYDTVPLFLLRSIPDSSSVVRLSSVAEKVNWRQGSVEVEFRSRIDGRKTVLSCKRLIVTVSIGVLQAAAGSDGGIQFDPEPQRALKAARALSLGQVFRVTFRFAEAFWEQEKPFQCAGFWISKDKEFPTWWTAHPVLSSFLTGWSSGSAAKRLRSPIMQQALSSLSRILGRKIPAPTAGYFHDWSRDPFFRGAYSYVPVGATGAREVLAEPVSDTIFFAGEAANVDGQASTVHGAIASGRRAVELIQKSRPTTRRRR